MEGCACNHAQQVRHLKSRTSQLEIMLDKAHRRLAASTATIATTPSVPNTAPIRALSTTTDVKKSDEYRHLQAELANERKIKMDLMANLKELTTSSETAQASLAQELAEVKSQRDALANELDEIQDEFVVFRDMFKSQAEYEEGESAYQIEHSKEKAVSTTEVPQYSRLSASVLRDFATHIDRVQERRLRTLLVSMAQEFPDELEQADIDADTETLEMHVMKNINILSTGYISEDLRRQCQLLSSKHDEDWKLSETLDSQVIVKNTLTLQDKVIQGLLERNATHCDLLYHSVPSVLEDLFTVLSRTSSFAYPETMPSSDAVLKAPYEAYLKQLSASLAHTIRKYITSHQKSRQKISYRSFLTGDLALFLPTRNANSPAWAAFNVGAPHYFLVMDGVETEGKDFLIGRIQDITEHNGEPGTDKHLRDMPDVRRWWEVRISEKKKVVSM